MTRTFFDASWPGSVLRPVNRMALALALVLAATTSLMACGGGSDSSPPTAATPAAVAAVSDPPASAVGAPFGATALNLAAAGYTEREYLVTGKANRYRIANPLATAVVVDGDHAYTTRILVRRPTDPAKFIGTVIVEWLNVTLTQDVDLVFPATRQHLLDNGYAWVGVSAQLVGTNTLNAVNPSRYSTVNITASNTDPAGGTLDARGDVLSWDIYAQVGQLLKSPGAVDPLGGLKVLHLIAAGESQSAVRLNSYYNAIQPLYPSVYEGFIGYDRFSALRTDLSAKALSVGTEWSRTITVGATPADSANIRYWEMAGSSHLSLSEMDDYLNEQVKRNGVLKAPDGTALSITEAIPGCDMQPIWSRVPNGDVVTAALYWMQAWLTTGTAPPKASRLYLDAGGNLYRNPQGQVSGGIRLAAYDAPLATNVGKNTGPGFCTLAGSHVDFTAAELCQRYGTPANYLARVISVTRKAEEDGFVLAADATRTISEASAVTFSCN